MKVAVVIVCYNSGVMLEKCLDHLAEQTWPADRILVVDNHSDDAITHQVLDAITGAEVMRLDANLGYGGAINRAVEALTDEDFVCCLNPDAFPRPGWLAALMKAAARHPAVGSFSSLMLNPDDNTIIDGAGDALHISGIPWRRFHNRRTSAVNLSPGPVFSACAGAALYRLDAFREAGGFDESFFMYVEDIDLGFRLQLVGYSCEFVPDAITEHIGSATTGARSDFTAYYGHRNLVAAYLKNMPGMLLAITLPLHLLATLWSILVLTFRGQGGIILRAKADAALDVPRRINQRRQVASRVSNGYIWRILQKGLA